ncbi:transglycosylase SLT domain-containing protein [Rhodocytophaga rosea]|uniref:Transglycosylase SLT domain-containing protein n=1 Tax=Rhodocytophaga rosea TaxID=2704465 RepID=A0A6C0GDK2_9BACT|nr:lytic transglycosylase domain-containing protein [Rhodocytophaga rosea]QHT65883.1 transglycosylase SLT domain-containing protein [Rhodocytophaga rosea]
MTVQLKCSKYAVGVSLSMLLLNGFSLFAQRDTVYAIQPQQIFASADSGKHIQAAQTNVIVAKVPLFAPSQIVTNLPETLVADQFDCMEEAIPMTYNEMSKKFVQRFLTKERQFISQMAERKQLYFPLYESLLQKHGLPDELKYLSIIESALNPRAISRAKAAGLWQFMPSTGRYFKLHQDAYIDERMNPSKATEAACIYLKDLHRMFGDWHLALAAYNCGPGNVRRAIRRSGNKTGFWQIYRHLPAETRAYVPKFIAVNYVMKHAAVYNINTSAIARIIPSDTIVVNQYLNMELLARMINVSLDDLRQLNPQVKKNIVPGYMKNYVLQIPAQKKDTFNLYRIDILKVMTLKSIVGRTKIHYKVKSSDELNTIAGKYEVSIENIRRWNRLRGNTVKSGTVLVIWASKSVLAINQWKTANEQLAAMKPALVSRIKVYFVRPGDTLAKISKLHGGVAVEKIIKHNRLIGQEVKPGQKLIIS